MADTDHLEMEGEIVDTAHSIFKVALDPATEDAEPVIVQCSIGGKLRKNRINLLKGDRVRIKVSPYDLSRGIITYRLG